MFLEIGAIILLVRKLFVSKRLNSLVLKPLVLKFLWNKAMCLSTCHNQGKGGLATLNRKHWTKKMVNHGMSPFHRAIWSSFNYKDKVIGFYNIYASNDYREREPFLGIGSPLIF